MEKLLFVYLVFVLFCSYVSSAPRRKKGKQLDDSDPDKYLTRFGYMLPIDPKTGSQQSHESRLEAIRKFQEMAHIPKTGIIDAKTREMMRRPRCGLPDFDFTGPRSDLPSRPAEFYAPGYKWSKKALTWHLQNFTPDIRSSGSQRRIMQSALQKWADVSGLSFREAGGDADIEIKFTRGNHGDGSGNSFDGPGGVLAHAFYPENGDTHFDEDETWTENTDKGTNLEIVAAHEFGHALGLSHSNVAGALMAPYYQGYSEDWKLHSDDVRGIQSLYGPNTRPVVTTTRRPVRPPVRTTTRPWRPTTTRRPTKGAPDKCKTKFDAMILHRDGKYYAFRGEYVFQIGYYGVNPGYPKPIRSIYPKAPKNMNAAVYSWRTRFTYFFKGSKIWKYKEFTLEAGYPKYMRDKAYPFKPSAALAWRDGRIYLFKGKNFYEFDEVREVPITTGYPKEISAYWPGIPGNIEAAVWARYDRKTYFFKGKNYRKFNDHYRRVDHGYPKEKAPAWMGCGTRQPK